MNLEHIGMNVPDPAAAAKWYCQHLGMTVKRAGPPPANGRFLADTRGEMMLEFYSNHSAPIPDYRTVHSQVLHVAFQVEDVRATRERLVHAGALAEGEMIVNDEGDVLAMLRDPWGVPIQLVKRAQAMI